MNSDRLYFLKKHSLFLKLSAVEQDELIKVLEGASDEELAQVREEFKRAEAGLNDKILPERLSKLKSSLSDFEKREQANLQMLQKIKDDKAILNLDAKLNGL